MREFLKSHIIGKTVFARIFAINILVALVCVIVLGSTQMMLMTNFIAEKTEEALSQNAESIVTLIKNNISSGSMRNMLSGFSRSSQSHIMIIDNKGRVLINTSESGFVDDTPSVIGGQYSRKVLNGQRHSVIGTMDGIFNETMFTLQVPVISGKEVIGAVLISSPMPEQQRMRGILYRRFLMSTILVVLVSFLLSYVLAKRFTRPIRSIQNSAKDFAKGNFNSRVDEIATKSDITEISELADTFNHMANELEKVEDVRNSFISDVSHELRTPMTTIGGFVNGILDDTIPQEKQKEYLKIVADETSRLSRLVNTFLDISRIQSDKIVMNKTNFDINEEIRLSIIGLEKKLTEKKIEVSLNFENDSCYVFADTDNIKRVLTNLLDNAVKFTIEGGEISVTVTPKHGEVEISVRNTGCGIPKEQLEMIFERLYKVDKSRSINRDGNGIGLYLVRSIIKAHGKNIKAYSKEGEWAEFIFTIDKGKAKKEEVQN